FEGEPDAASQILSLLEQRPRSAGYLVSKVKDARSVLRNLVKRGGVAAEDTQDARDPLRMPAERLQVEFLARPEPSVKLKKSERELLAFLELHPGPHNVGELGETVAKASEATRALARRDLVKLSAEEFPAPAAWERPVPVLN